MDQKAQAEKQHLSLCSIQGRREDTTKYIGLVQNGQVARPALFLKTELTELCDPLGCYNRERQDQL